MASLSDDLEVILVPAALIIAALVAWPLLKGAFQNDADSVAKSAATAAAAAAAAAVKGAGSALIAPISQGVTNAGTAASAASQDAVSAVQSLPGQVATGAAQTVWDSPIYLFDRFRNWITGAPLNAWDRDETGDQSLADFEAGNVLVPLPGNTDFAPINSGGGAWNTGQFPGGN